MMDIITSTFINKQTLFRIKLIFKLTDVCLECAVDVGEERMFAGQLQDVSFRQGTFHVVIFQNDIFLQNFNCKILTSTFQFG